MHRRTLLEGLLALAATCACTGSTDAKSSARGCRRAAAGVGGEDRPPVLKSSGDNVTDLLDEEGVGGKLKARLRCGCTANV